MPTRVLPPEHELRSLYESGMSATEISEKLGANRNTVASAIARLGIGRTPKETKKSQKERGVKRRVGKSFWLGKKQPDDLVEKRISKIRGKNHYSWKGGESRRGYRKILKKEECIICGSRLNLAIHHIDLDHYNNNLDNLQVVCVSCHSSIHSRAYWDAIHSGKTPPKSNAPIGWNRKGGDVALVTE